MGSRAAAERLLDDGAAVVDGERRPKSYRLEGGEQVELTVPEPVSTDLEREDVPLRIAWEDEHILVVDKPPGLLTVATERERERTAYRMVWAYLKGARPPRRPFIVHRLDRETSGLLVVAKTPEAQARLQGQFAAGNAERRYAAIVEGVVTRDEGMLRDVLIEERSLRVRPADPGRPPPKGRRARIAITWYRVLERRADVTRLAVRLGTGRRHQIRVQLAKIGHPIVGDARHGARRDPLRRLGLHATRLGFHHPDTGAPIEFDSAPPAEFASVGRPADRPAPSTTAARDSAAREPRPGRARPGRASAGPDVPRHYRPPGRASTPPDPSRPGGPPSRPPTRPEIPRRSRPPGRPSTRPDLARPGRPRRRPPR